MGLADYSHSTESTHTTQGVTGDGDNTAAEVRARTRTESIHDEIRNRICLLLYPPGTKLREQELAEEFGVSRTPIRQVLQQLAIAGLVEIRNGVGTLVTDLDHEAVHEIYAFRLRIAPMIGELEPKPCAPNLVATLEDLLPRARGLVSRFDVREYFEVNHATHFTVSAIIGNIALREAWDRLYFQAARFWFSVAISAPAPVTRSLVREIEDLCEAMRRDDAMAVGFIQCAYIAFGRDMVSRQIPRPEELDDRAQRAS